MSNDFFELNLAGNAIRPTFSDFLTNTISSIVIPFCSTKLESIDDENVNVSFTVKVNKDVYNSIVKKYHNDSLIIFYRPEEGQFGVWSFDMIKTFEILQNFSLLESIDDWIKNAHQSMSLYESKNIKSKNNIDDDKKQLLKDFLDSIKILPTIKHEDKQTISNIINIVIRSNTMDYQTLIYRISMGIFHVKFSTGKSLTEIMEKPHEIYLNLVNSDFYKEHKQKFTWEKMPMQSKIVATRFLFCFVLAMYFYYEEVTKIVD